MTMLQKSLLVGVIQLLLVLGVGAKFMIDRANYPRVWVQTRPYDPDLPIRGRYVQVRVVVAHDAPPVAGGYQPQQTRLEVRDHKLVAVDDVDGRHSISGWQCGDQKCWVLWEPLAYFIPEHVDDPSNRKPGEELWVEVTVPPKGAPRPIRLGVKSDGKIRPLDLR